MNIAPTNKISGYVTNMSVIKVHYAVQFSEMEVQRFGNFGSISSS